MGSRMSLNKSSASSNWPFLFHNEFLLSHYDQLVDGKQSSSSLFLAMQYKATNVLRLVEIIENAVCL